MAQPPRKFLPLPPRETKPALSIPEQKMSTSATSPSTSEPHPCEYALNLLILQVARDFGIDAVELKKSRDAVLQQLRNEEEKETQEKRDKLYEDLISWLIERYNSDPEGLKYLLDMFEGDLPHINDPRDIELLQSDIRKLVNNIKTLDPIEVDDVDGAAYKDLSYTFQSWTGETVTVDSIYGDDSQNGWPQQTISINETPVYDVNGERETPKFTRPLPTSVLFAVFFIVGWNPNVSFGPKSKTNCI